MVGCIKKQKKQMDGGWIERIEKIYGWQDGYKKYMKKMDGWMDKKKKIYMDGWME